MVLMVYNNVEVFNAIELYTSKMVSTINLNHNARNILPQLQKLFFSR